MSSRQFDKDLLQLIERDKNRGTYVKTVIQLHHRFKKKNNVTNTKDNFLIMLSICKLFTEPRRNNTNTYIMISTIYDLLSNMLGQDMKIVIQ